jgi:pimeloyl-ACP methyl ester carboxylesterase
LDVPIYFFNGKNDYNTSVELVEEYYEEISAPAKELIIFEKSAHLPFIAEREKFSEELIQIKNENYLVEKN